MVRYLIKIVLNLYFYKIIIFVWIYLYNFYICGIILLEFVDLIIVLVKWDDIVVDVAVDIWFR